MSGFSEEVAIAVTHPLWPSNEPRKRSDSDIVCAEGLSSSKVEIWGAVSRHISHRDSYCTVTLSARPGMLQRFDRNTALLIPHRLLPPSSPCQSAQCKSFFLILSWEFYLLKRREIHLKPHLVKHVNLYQMHHAEGHRRDSTLSDQSE